MTPKKRARETDEFQKEEHQKVTHAKVEEQKASTPGTPITRMVRNWGVGGSFVTTPESADELRRKFIPTRWFSVPEVSDAVAGAVAGGDGVPLTVVVYGESGCGKTTASLVAACWHKDCVAVYSTGEALKFDSLKVGYDDADAAENHIIQELAGLKATEKCDKTVVLILDDMGMYTNVVVSLAKLDPKGLREHFLVPKVVLIIAGCGVNTCLFKGMSAATSYTSVRFPQNVGGLGRFM